MSRACLKDRTHTLQGISDMASNTSSLCSLADGFKALADATRLHIVYLLMTRGEMCVCEFMGLLDATQSNISFHLKSLKYAGFITSRKEGKWMFYSLNRKALEKFRAEFGDVFDLDRWPENAKHTSSCDIPACRQMDLSSEEKH